jgi:hypothetical protein
MKRLALIVGGVSLFAWGVFGALTACGGDDGTTAVTDTDAGGTSTSSGGSSGTPNTSSSGGSSGSPSDDGGTDGGGGGDGGGEGGGGVQSNAGKVTCGAAECTLPAQYCCRSFTGDAGCIDDNDNCPGGGAEINCDEKADCPGQEVCCGSSFNQDQRCESTNSCDGFSDFTICKVNAECTDGGTCKEWSCPGGRKVRSCAMPFTGCQ